MPQIATTAPLPDINQFQDHIREFMAYLVLNNRADLIAILKSIGAVVKSNMNDKELLTTVYTAMRVSKTFKRSLQDLMTNVATKQLKMSPRVSNYTGPAQEDIYSFVKNGVVTKPGFDGVNEIDGVPVEASGADNIMTGAASQADPNYVTMPEVTVSTTIPSTNKTLAQTGIGAFLSNLFSAQNINKAISTGLDLLNQKMSASATQAQIDAATQLQVHKTQAEIAKQQAQVAASKWIVPLIIGAVIIAGAVIAYKLYNKKTIKK